MSASTPFEVAQRCVDKKQTFYSGDVTSLNYMTLRFLSMHQKGFVAAINANEVSCPTTKDLVIPYAQMCCRQSTAPFFKYIKGESVKLTEKQKHHVKLLMSRLHVSKEHAIDTLHLLQETGFDFDKAFGQIAKVSKSPK